MLNGLDLFSGIGGITAALAPRVRPLAYCENDRYAIGVLLSRMASGDLPCAPIWDDIKTLDGEGLPAIDIIYGGFPCQDISCAGRGAGLDGERSGLFKEIIRLTAEIRPSFVFLENVSAITVRGLDTVLADLIRLGYDTRWTCLRASDVGAPHYRNRWWLLAYSNGSALADASSGRCRQAKSNTESMGQKISHADRSREDVAHAEEPAERAGFCASGPRGERSGRSGDGCGSREQWSIEPDVGRVVNGLPHRVDRLRCLGNAVVPLQAQTAFQILMGL